MHDATSSRTLVLLALVTACGSESPSASADPPPSPVVVAQPTSAEPIAEPTPAEPTPTAEPTEPVAPASSLHVVAVREGNIDLLSYRDAPIAAIEGEPVRWVSGRFTPEPDGGRGLPPSLDPMALANVTLALGGDPQAPTPTWVTIEKHFERTGSTYEVQQRRGDRWQAVALPKQPLTAHYASYVERQGALLALQTWSIPDDLESHESEDEEGAELAEAEYQAQLRKQQRAKPKWVQLSGAKIATPEIPAKTSPYAAVSTRDGTILALSRGEGEASHQLLMWPPSVAKAEPIALPELDRAWMLELGVSDEWVLAFGSLEHDQMPAEAYLALGQGDQWQRVPTSLPGRDHSGLMHIRSAARARDGELWIALGAWQDHEEDSQSLWRKPVDGEWAPVPLPSPSPALYGAGKRWELDGIYGRNDWSVRDSIRLGSARARGVVAAAGAIWVTLDVGSMGIPIGAVLTTDPSVGDPVVLPPSWKTELQRYDDAVRGAKPGSARCETVSLVLGPASLASERPELARSIQALELEDDPLAAVYTGELDGAQVLVARAFVVSTKHAQAVRAAVAEATGLPVALDCRVPILETMVSP